MYLVENDVDFHGICLWYMLLYRSVKLTYDTILRIGSGVDSLIWQIESSEIPM